MSRLGAEPAASRFTTTILKCDEIAAQRFQPSDFMEFSFQVESLVSYVALPNPAESEWTTAVFDRKLGRSFKSFSDQQAIAADSLFLAIAQDLPKDVVFAATRLQSLAGDFTQSINAAIGDER